MSDLHTPRDVTDSAAAAFMPPFGGGIVDEDDEGDVGDDEYEPDSLMLDEDSDAPNLVPEGEPRGILARQGLEPVRVSAKLTLNAGEGWARARSTSLGAVWSPVAIRSRAIV